MDAKTKRQEAIGMLSELYLPTSYLVEAQGERPIYLLNSYAARYATGAEVAENIEKLAQLGRTARWQSAIDRWARMVRESSGNVDSLRWAFLQGMVYAGHASE
jgi:hypothetical protein